MDIPSGLCGCHKYKNVKKWFVFPAKCFQNEEMIMEILEKYEISKGWIPVRDHAALKKMIESLTLKEKKNPLVERLIKWFPKQCMY